MLGSKEVEGIRLLLKKKPRLSYIFESALDDFGRNLNYRAFRLSRKSKSGFIMRSKFGDINVVYLTGDCGGEDFEWVDSFNEKGELHCEAIHRDDVLKSKLSRRIVSVSQVNYYLLKGRPDADTGSAIKARQLASSDRKEAMEFISEHNRDPIHYPAMFELPAVGIWSDGRLISLAATLYLNPRLNACQIGMFITHPDYRGRGLAKQAGRSLLNILAKKGLDTFRLEVYKDNPAKRVYETLGFKLEDEAPMAVLSSR